MANIVRCSSCEYFFSARRSDLKRRIARGGAVGGTVLGGVIGRHAGLAAGRTARAAAVPAGITAALAFGLGVALGAEWALPLATCPRCNKHSGLLAPLSTGPRFTYESVARALAKHADPPPQQHSCSPEEPRGFVDGETLPVVERPCSFDEALEETVREPVLQH